MNNFVSIRKRIAFVLDEESIDSFFSPIGLSVVGEVAIIH